jgi:chromosome partitioning protein
LGKRVLLIDLDFQGSLSSMAFPDGQWLPQQRQTSIAAKLISNDLTPDLVDQVAREIPLDNAGNGAGRLKIITSYYDLAQADNRIMVEWLLKTRCVTTRNILDAAVKFFRGKLFHDRDVRYTLANILHSDAVRDAFDLIIIDCPPRLTTSEVQAFCASSHVLIPTILERTSAEAVYTICQQIETLRQAGVCPHLKIMGVVGTMWQRNAVAQQQGAAVIRAALETLNLEVRVLHPDTFVQRSAFLVNSAENGIAYLTMPNGSATAAVRGTIEQLAGHVARQLGVPPPTVFAPLARAAE